MTQFQTKGRENSGSCACFPLSWGEGRGEGERFLQSHFRSRRRIFTRQFEVRLFTSAATAGAGGPHRQFLS